MSQAVAGFFPRYRTRTLRKSEHEDDDGEESQATYERILERVGVTEQFSPAVAAGLQFPMINGS